MRHTFLTKVVAIVVPKNPDKTHMIEITTEGDFGITHFEVSPDYADTYKIGTKVTVTVEIE